MIRSLLRSLSNSGAVAGVDSHVSSLRNPFSLCSTRAYAKAQGGAKARGKDKRGAAADEEASPEFSSSIDLLNADFDIPTSPLPPKYDKELDVGPNGRPLFAFTKTFSEFTHKDACVYVDFSLDEWNAMLPEGLPQGMTKEFEDTRRCAVMVRENFLELRDNFRRIVDPSISSRKKEPKKQIVLDGPRSCGKSIALAMLVHWARTEGWLVFYVPRGKEWTHGGFFYKNPYNGLWDTPIQATRILQDFLKFNESRLQQLPCQIFEPIPLGEGAGVGMMQDADSLSMPEGSTLYDLIQTGITYSNAAVGVVVRLREELSLVKDVPVLFAIDQFNNWFTFSEYEEPVTVRSSRPIHARELTTVNAYRSMLHDDMMIGAFSHSTAVGKLRQELPDVPLGSRVMFPRYTLEEAETVCHYYLRQKLIKREKFSEDRWKKIYFLSNGNGSEMRWLASFI